MYTQLPIGQPTLLLDEFIVLDSYVGSQASTWQLPYHRLWQFAPADQALFELDWSLCQVDLPTGTPAVTVAIQRSASPESDPEVFEDMGTYAITSNAAQTQLEFGRHVSTYGNKPPQALGRIEVRNTNAGGGASAI